MISVITTVFNAEPFLGESINSVITQNVRDLELILVDDGSTDKSYEIASGYAQTDSRVRLLHHDARQNRGISASRNLGVDNSAGEFIAFLDADDVWLPGKLERQLNDLQNNPTAAMAFGAAKRWYSWNSKFTPADDFIVPSAIPGRGADCIVPPPELLHAYLRDESLTPCTCTVLVRRQALLEVGGFEDAFRGLYDDQVLYAKLCLEKPVYVSSECLAFYRQHDASCCAQARNSGGDFEERQRFLSWLQRYQQICIP